MTAEKNLHILIRNLKPHLHAEKYVFVSVNSEEVVPLENIVSLFQEEEGISLVIEQSKAEELGISYNYVAAWITLKVHSSLEAVGLTAKVSSALAEAGISCNAIAALHHDHIFVPWHKADLAMSILRKL